MSPADAAPGFDGQLTDVTPGLASGAVHFEGPAAKLAEEAFGHLAADAITGTENQNAMTHRLSPACFPEGRQTGKHACRKIQGPAKSRVASPPGHDWCRATSRSRAAGGAQQADFAAGFTARRKAAMNLPAICGPAVSGSRPAARRNSLASSTR